MEKNFVIFSHMKVIIFPAETLGGIIKQGKIITLNYFWEELGPNKA